MKVVRDNIWNFLGHSYWVVVPTNGDVNKDGYAVMGRGIALQASKRFPQLKEKLGSRLLAHGNKICVFPEFYVITFPVKHHWYDKADIQLVEDSIDDLAILSQSISFNCIVMPKVGCGNGKLQWKQVSNVIDTYMNKFSRFTNVVIVDKT